MSEVHETFDLVVRVVAYGTGPLTADMAARALVAYQGTFELPAERVLDEVEIIAAEPRTATIPNRQTED